MGNIGDDQKEYEFQPLEVPGVEPVKEPAAPTPEPVKEPVPA
jgi:hypothetical protein